MARSSSLCHRRNRPPDRGAGGIRIIDAASDSLVGQQESGFNRTQLVHGGTIDDSFGGGACPVPQSAERASDTHKSVERPGLRSGSSHIHTCADGDGVPTGRSDGHRHVDPTVSQSAAGREAGGDYTTTRHFGAVGVTAETQANSFRRVAEWCGRDLSEWTD